MTGAADDADTGPGPDPADREPAPEDARVAGERLRPAAHVRIGRSALAVAGVVVAYYAVPIDDMPSSWNIGVVVLGLVAGLGVLARVGVRQVRTLARDQVGDPGARLDVLALVVIVFVPLFALGFYAVEQADASQFADLETKTDALYFTMSTLATVGFGDVHARGQAARALVTVQIVFNLVVVTALASVLTTQLRARVAERRAADPPSAVGR